MFFWVLTICSLMDKLEALADKIDKDTMKEALNMERDAKASYERVLRLNDKKVLVVNLKVMADCITRVLNYEERLILISYVKGRSYDEIAQIIGHSKSTVHRRMKRIALRCETALLNLGYSEERLVREYSDYAPVRAMMVRVRKRETVNCCVDKDRNCKERVYA